MLMLYTATLLNFYSSCDVYMFLCMQNIVSSGRMWKMYSLTSSFPFFFFLTFSFIIVFYLIVLAKISGPILK